MEALLETQHQNQNLIEKAYVLFVILPTTIFLGAIYFDGWLKDRKKRKKKPEAK